MTPGRRARRSATDQRPLLLSRSKCSCLLLIFLLSQVGSHVVFEEIGQMAGATSYIHLSITLGLSDLEERINDYSKCIAIYKHQVNSTFTMAYSNTTDKDRNHTLHVYHARYLDMAATFQRDAGHLKTQIRNIRGILPAPSNGPAPSNYDRDKRSLVANLLIKTGGKILKGLGGQIFKTAKNGVLRQARSPGLLFTLANGILGTFMGLYTQHQINKLRADVDQLKETQDQLVEVVVENKAAIGELKTWMSHFNISLSILENLNPGLVVAEMTNMYNRIQSALDVTVHTLQQAMHRRLAIDFLTPDNLAKVFEDLVSVAAEKGFDLLTKRPSDLLQIETSYVYDGNDVLLLLHVPMTPADSLLRLLRLRPFPIPFSDSHSLLPRPQTSILALSKGQNRLMTTIEHSDLLGCHQIGTVYTCDRHGALQKNIKSNCLGALFEQDIAEARRLCDLELVPRKEAVLQLESNWFLVYSPVMFTAHTTCQNGTSSEVYIKREVRKVYVDPGCSLDLNHHQLSSEISLYLDSNVRHIDWDREDISLFGLKESDVLEALAETEVGERGLLLADIVQHTKSKSKFPLWKILISTISAVGLISLISILMATIGAQWVVRIRTKVRLLRNTLTTVLPALTQHLERVFQHLHLPRFHLPRLHLYPQINEAPADAPIPAPSPPPPFYPPDPAHL